MRSIKCFFTIYSVQGFGPPGSSFPPNHPASISPAVGNVPAGSGPPGGPSGSGSSHPNILVPAGPPPSGSQPGQQSSSQGMMPPRGSFGSGRVIPVGAPQGPGGPGGPIGSGASTVSTQNQGSAQVRFGKFAPFLYRFNFLV